MTLAPKTATEALNLSSPQVSVIRKECGEVVLNAFLTLAISDMVESFNVGNTMDDMQIVFTVNAIKGQYWYLRPDELKYVFNRAKMGLYGTMYNRIDCAVICGWIEKYLEERNQVIYDSNIEKNKLNKKITLADYDPKVLKTIHDAGILSETEKRTEVVRTKPVYENHDIHQRWLTQFDKLRIRFGDKGGRFIWRYGKWMDVTEYFEKKAQQMILAKNRTQK